MRWILIAVLAALVTIDVQATEAMPGTEVVALRDAPSLIDASELAPGVTVSAIPMPAPVLEVMQPGNPLNRLHAAKKSRLARKKPAPTIMLTRTERRQLALAVGDAKVAGLRNHAYHQNDDSKTGLDELDFHRSYSRRSGVVARNSPALADGAPQGRRSPCPEPGAGVERSAARDGPVAPCRGPPAGRDGTSGKVFLSAGRQP